MLFCALFICTPTLIHTHIYKCQHLIIYCLYSCISLPIGGVNPCSGNGGCSHLCLLGTNGTKECQCPQIMNLMPNNLRCIRRCTSCSWQFFFVADIFLFCAYHIAIERAGFTYECVSCVNNWQVLGIKARFNYVWRGCWVHYLYLCSCIFLQRLATSNKIACLILCHRSVILGTFKSDINVIDVCYLWRYVVVTGT